MGQTARNLIIILGFITIAWGGYYLYSSQATELDASTDIQLQDMLANTSVFIQRSQELSAIDLQLSLFEDNRFTSLRTHSQPLKSQSIGRNNPFAAPESSNQFIEEEAPE